MLPVHLIYDLLMIIQPIRIIRDIPDAYPEDLLIMPLELLAREDRLAVSPFRDRSTKHMIGYGKEVILHDPAEIQVTDSPHRIMPAWTVVRMDMKRALGPIGRIRIAAGEHHAHPLSPELRNAWTNIFWKSVNAIRSGSETIRVAAMSNPHSAPPSAC